MSWENSKTEDMLWGARKLALAVAGGIESVLDAKDPTGMRRQGMEPDGTPMGWDADAAPTMVEFLDDWGGKLRRLNSMLWEISSRMEAERKEADGDVPAAVPSP